MGALNATKIATHAPFELRVRLFATVMHEQDVFGRNRDAQSLYTIG